jgi:FkbM family methyltransferase
MQLKKNTRFNPLTPLLKLARGVEKVSGFAQGKGYGSATIVQENRLVQQLLSRQATIAIDIGGNIGSYTVELRRRNPRAEIHIFEPSATNIEKLNQRFFDDKKIIIVPFAVAENDGSATLFSDAAGSGMGSLTQRRLGHFSIEFNVAEIVKKIRFETYWHKILNGCVLDIVKMDVEGHELAVLKGFGKSIFSTRVIQFEFGGCNIDTRTYFQDFWYFFKDHQFDLFRITPLGVDMISKYKEADEFFSTCNYIAVNRNQSL